MVGSLKKVAVAQALLLALSLCEGHAETKQVTKGDPVPQEADRPVKSQESIGMAEMSSDGTITLYLVGKIKSGMILHAVKTYQRDDPRYKEVLDHIGPMRPGEKKPVPPWPD